MAAGLDLTHDFRKGHMSEPVSFEPEKLLPGGVGFR